MFCTAYDEYTLQVIKNNGIGYVLKPFKEREIHSALQEYKRWITNIRSKNPFPVHSKMEAAKPYQKSLLRQYREKPVVSRAAVAAFEPSFNRKIIL